MDTLTDSSGALDTNQAANLFSSLIDPPVEDKDEPKKEVKAEAKLDAEEAPPATPEATDEATDDDPLVKLVIDGQEVEVKTSELKRAYGKEAAAHKRFEEAAQVRKQADAETARARQERQAYAANLQNMRIQLEGALQAQQQTVDWDKLLREDPVEYLHQERLAKQRQATLQQINAEQGKVQTQMKAEAAIAFERHLDTQQKELLTKLPEWKDGEKAKAERTAIREYLTNQGYEEADVNGISDARAVVLARKAMLYDQIIGKAQAASKKVSTLPSKVERPGTGDNPGLDKRGAAFQRLGKTGRLEDAAAVFASLL